MNVDSGKTSKRKADDGFSNNEFTSFMLKKFKGEIASFDIPAEHKVRQQITEAFFKAFLYAFQELKQLYDNNQLGEYKVNSVRIDAVFKNQDYDSIYKYLLGLSKDIETCLYQVTGRTTAKDSPYYAKAKMLLIYLKKPNQVKLKLEVLTKAKEPSEVCNLTEAELMSAEQKHKLESLQSDFMKDREIVTEKIYLKSRKGDIELNAEEDVALPVAMESDHDNNNDSEEQRTKGDNDTHVVKDRSDHDDYDFSKDFDIKNYKGFLEGKIKEILNGNSADVLIKKLDDKTEQMLKNGN